MNSDINLILEDLSPDKEYVVHNYIISLLNKNIIIQNQLESYENMRKEAIEYANNSIDLLTPPCVSNINKEEYEPYIIIHENYLDILNKVGEDND